MYMKFELGSIIFSSWSYAPYVAVCLVVGALCASWSVYKKSRVVELLSHARWRKKMFPSYSFMRNCVASVCMILSFACVGVALMQPQWGELEQVVVQEGRDLFIVLDVSRSMLSQDVKPNRLDAAKHKIKQLVSRLKSERVGLILFSGSAFVQCPLTTDVDALYMFLNVLDAETISSGSTSLDQALQKAQAAFKKQNHATKLVMVITDGEDFSSNLQSVTRAAREDGLTIFTLGMATENGGPIPVIEDGKQTGVEMDAQGNVVLSRLNEGILSTVAADGGGIYVRVTPDDTDVTKIVSYIDTFEKQLFDDRAVTTLQERYYYPLAGALILFLCAWII